MKILVLNGPNLNLLGVREPETYGNRTYKELLSMVHKCALENGVAVEIFQSNHEGALVDKIQSALGNFDGIIINPAAYTHTSIAILDALKAVNLPAIEVHISDVTKREDFRQISYVRAACIKSIVGHGLEGYCEAIREMIDYIQGGQQTC